MGLVWRLRSNALELTYDGLGNLLTAVTATAKATKTIDYTIDGFGRRVGKQVGGTFVRAWLYRDQLRPISEVTGEGVFSHFVYAGGASGAPDFMLRAGVPFRFVKDHLGSVRLVVNATTGVVAQVLEYDEFGNVTRDTLPGFQPFGFAGGLYDADTGLVRFGARDYDASVGRWVSKDPIGFEGGHNLYAYCDGDPVNNVDPTGHRKYSGTEVEAFLMEYRAQIDQHNMAETYWIMWNRHKGCGTDDYWCKDDLDVERDGPDTYDVRGRIMNGAQFGNYIAGYAAGYRADPLAYDIVRAAGSFYGVIGSIFRQGGAQPELSQLLFLGDNLESVVHIDIGTGDGFRDKLKRMRRRR